jgi:chromosome segregation ATPase
MRLFGKRLGADEMARLQDEVATLKQQLERHDRSTRELAAEVTERAGTVGALTERVAALHARVTSVSTELANQLNELGHDIDGLASQAHTNGNGEVALGELRDGQVRLANEQARYQIAFREDLARLADDVRRVTA